jgi:hypothetical protein
MRSRKETGKYEASQTQNAPNKACTGRLGASQCAFFEPFPELWQFSVSGPFSPQPPVTPTVDCNNMGYMFKPSEIAKFSRIFDDSSLKRV